MGIRDRIPLLNALDGYEQVSTVGCLLLVLGSLLSWLTVQADAAAAAQLDGIEPGTTPFTGIDLGFGVLTLVLGLLAAALIGLVVWRYGTTGRKTGLGVMLLGLIAVGVAGVGIVLTGSLFGQADVLAGVSVDLGTGIILTFLGALVVLAGGILRLVAGSPSG